MALLKTHLRNFFKSKFSVFSSEAHHKHKGIYILEDSLLGTPYESLPLVAG